MPTCDECGNAYMSVRSTKLFCSSDCRQAFNLRRRERGAELYDAIMSGAGQDTLDKLTAAYKAADNAKRQGRRSWQPWRKAVLNIPMVYGRSGDDR